CGRVSTARGRLYPVGTAAYTGGNDIRTREPGSRLRGWPVRHRPPYLTWVMPAEGARQRRPRATQGGSFCCPRGALREGVADGRGRVATGGAGDRPDPGRPAGAGPLRFIRAVGRPRHLVPGDGGRYVP